MTNEELVEEIFYKAHQKGIRTEVLLRVSKVMDENPKTNFYDAVHIAYKIEKDILKNKI